MKSVLEMSKEEQAIYIREKAERKVMSKINNKLKIIRELKLSC